MNRHIYGLTLFLFIVKLHFLLYWAFFAPVNFFSTQEIVNSSAVPFEANYSKSCWRMKTLNPELQNVAVDTRQGTVSANVDFATFESVSDLHGKRFALHIFSNNFVDVWSGEVRLATMEDDSTFEFKTVTPELKTLDRKANYYARIELLSEHSQYPHDSFDLNAKSDATPVLINFGKTDSPK